MMKKLLYIILSLVLFTVPAVSEQVGGLKVVFPSNGCSMILDNIPIETGGGNQYSIQANSGTHHLQMLLVDGTEIFNGDIRVYVGEITTIRPNLSRKQIAQMGTKEAEAYLSEKIRIEDSDIEGRDEKGFSIGVESTHYTGLFNPYTRDDSPIPGYTALASLSGFYSFKITPKWYIKNNLDFTAPSSVPTKFGVTVNSFSVASSLQYKIDRNIIVGAGINYSIWRIPYLSESYFNYISSPGFQVYCDIKPLSSEIGYITRNVMIHRKDGSPYGINDKDVLLNGFYYKYILYL